MARSCGFAPPSSFFPRDLRSGYCSPQIRASRVPHRFDGNALLRIQKRDLCVSNPSRGWDRRYGRRSLALAGVEGEMEESGERAVVRTLLVDNYDSYTYNVYQELSVVNGLPPVVVHNDEWSWEYIRQLLYDNKSFDNIVISPGPGSPSCSADIGICLQLLMECVDIPILGVCLGHQALGLVHGAEIVHAAETVHGRLSEVEHNNCDLFERIPSGRNSGYKVVRYHSLVINPETLPKCLIPTAWTTSSKTLSFLDVQDPDISSSEYFKGKSQPPYECDSNILMGIKHSTMPHYGVQFHPESVATCYGRQIFENFKRLTVKQGLRSVQRPASKRFHKHHQSDTPVNGKSLDGLVLVDHLSSSDLPNHLSKCAEVKHLKLKWKRFCGLSRQVGGPENIFLELFGNQNGSDTFWLDSSSTDKRRARFSFMGGKGGHLWKQLTFWLAEPRSPATRNGGYLDIQDQRGSRSRVFLKDGFLDFMDKEIQSFQYDKGDYDGLPFEFYGGFVGFLGYNLKVECGARSNLHNSSMPDACFFFADNVAVIDHSNDDVYILSIRDTSQKFNSDAGIDENLINYSWLEETEKRLLTCKTSRYHDHKKHVSPSSASCKSGFVMERSKHQYVRDVRDCLNYIRDGESYELCLTTQMKRRAKDVDALKVYLDLRNHNPAPYSAWLRFSKDNLSICCSSPERFLRLDGSGMLEAKPIKGTISRGATVEEDERLRLQLQYSEKDQAENLMIVDLLRNDLGRVCESGTVHVPRLMEVESYATVHTLVSTIQGKKKSNLSPIDCVKAAFPGGSMTGAPKLRSMEILDSIETCSRGVYSGSIGFFSYNQTFDLNIVIRTVVIHNDEASVGAGGAIVALSKPEDEYQEMLLKARAPTQVVENCVHKSDPSERRFFMTT